MSSNAQVLFESLSKCANTQEVLEKISASPETEFCECKSGKTPLSEIKKYWSEALSGFSNTSGGVLIWGIDCRERNGLPQLQLDLVPNTGTLKKQLDSRILDAIDPHLSGIQFLEIGDASGGLLSCFIPEGPSKPYAGRHEYFMRIRDRFANVPPSFLRTLFYPEQRTRLIIDVMITGRKDGSRFLVSYEAFLMNVGNASALDLFCTANTSLTLGWSFPTPLWIGSNNYSVPAAEFTRPVHPSGQIPLGSVPIGSADEQGKIREQIYISHTWFEFRVYSHNQAAQQGRVTFEAEDVKLGAKKTVVLEPFSRV